MQQGLCNSTVSVCPSFICCSSTQQVCCCSAWAGDIDQLLHGMPAAAAAAVAFQSISTTAGRSAANASSVMCTAMSSEVKYYGRLP